MEINNENELFASMIIQIWNNKYSNELFYYNNNKVNEFKKVYFTFNKNNKDCFLIKTKDNYIEILVDHKDFNENEGKEILFRIRYSLKNNYYEVMNPIFGHKISDYNNYLNDKIWFSVRSQSYLGGNQLNYNLNENDIIKIGRKKYCIVKIHFENDNRKENAIDEDFYKNNNISYISIMNKESKPAFNIDIKPNKYKIRKNKNINIQKANKVNEEKVNEVNIKESQNIKQNTNGDSKDTNYNSINTKNIINNKDNNISTKKCSQNNGKNNKNNYQSSVVYVSTKSHSCNDQIDIENESNIDNENENDKCWLCAASNCDEDNPLICLCDCPSFIHFECLKMYLNSNSKSNSNLILTKNLKKTVTTYTWKIFNCEMCFKPYKLRFRIPEFNKIYELIDLNLPEKLDYICLESLDYIKDKNNIKTLHIVQLKDQEINIGRNNYNDIIDNDISVSRDHAVLKYNKNNKSLILENKNGRYGTLVLVRGNIKINKEKTYFQILNTHISMELTNKKILDKIGKESFQFNAIYDNNDDNDN